MSTDLKALKQMERKICILHYACSNFQKTPVEISSIALIEYNDKKAHVFSRVDFSEMDMLVKFYDFISDHPNYVFVGCNLKDITYGVEVIDRRYKQIMGEDAPCEYGKVFDIDGIFQNAHGHSYISHGEFGKMHSLFVLNDINANHFINGKMEAELFERGDLRKIELSNVCKADGIKNVIKLSFENKLKIGNKKNIVIRFLGSAHFKILTLGSQIMGFCGIGS